MMILLLRMSIMSILFHPFVSSFTIQPNLSSRQHSTFQNNHQQHHECKLTTTTSLHHAAVSNINQDGKCKFGTKEARLVVADCRDLPIPTGTIDATLDKGTLDAIYITGKQVFYDSVKELTRVTAVDGIIVCVSAVIPQEELLEAFQTEGSGDGGGSSSSSWETVLDGGLAFADSGEATIDLGANLYSFRRK